MTDQGTERNRDAMAIISRKGLEAQLAYKSPEYWERAQAMVGKENFYYDRACRFGIVTIDLHAGTTPMFLPCRNPQGCSGVMGSMGYPDPTSKPAWLGEPTHGWYRPEFVDDDRDDEETDHVMAGGLLLRKLKEADYGQIN